MAAFRYEQIVVDGIEISEVWGVANVPDERKAPVIAEWVQRHGDRARANGFTHTRLSVDPNDPGHLLHEAWPALPEDEGAPRWFAGD